MRRVPGSQKARTPPLAVVSTSTEADRDSVWGDDVFSRPTWTEQCQARAIDFVESKIREQEVIIETLSTRAELTLKLLKARLESQSKLGKCHW